MPRSKRTKNVQTVHLPPKGRTICVFNVSVKDAFLNISLIKLTYSGANTKDCLNGGVAYFEEVQVDDSDATYEELPTFCDNFIIEPKNDTFDKVATDVVSMSSHIIIVLYAYKSYSPLQFNLKISPTACQGIMTFTLIYVRYVRITLIRSE